MYLRKFSIMSVTSATALGFTAILMWALLALLSATAGDVPPFQLAALCFTIGGLLAVITWPFRPGVLSRLKALPIMLWVVGITCLFGYHFFYFAAIQSAPAVEVSLIAYLWPLLLVVFSAFLPGEKLKKHHIIGVVLGLIGAVLVITRGQSFNLSQGLQPGHLLALPCAFIWAFYSVMARRFGKVPTDVIAIFCLSAALLSVLAHFAFEKTIWPQTEIAWAAVLALGVFPLGLAFYSWDFGLKHGDIIVLGALSYTAPLLSTLILLAVGIAHFHWSILAACLLISAGALIAAKDLLWPPKP